MATAGKPSSPLEFGDYRRTGQFRIRPTKFFGMCVIEELVQRRDIVGDEYQSWERVRAHSVAERVGYSDGTSAVVDLPFSIPFKGRAEQ